MGDYNNLVVTIIIQNIIRQVNKPEFTNTFGVQARFRITKFWPNAEKVS